MQDGGRHTEGRGAKRRRSVLIFVLFINNGRSKCIWHHAAPRNPLCKHKPPPSWCNTLLNGRRDLVSCMEGGTRFQRLGLASKKRDPRRHFRGALLKPTLKSSLSSANCKSANVQREFATLPNHAPTTLARWADSYVKKERRSSS